MTPAQSFLAWAITACVIAGVVFRPRQWPEAVWTCLGALLLAAFRLVPPGAAAGAAAKGADVYLFLTGMMLLAELARREGVFDWVAAMAVRASGESRARLFGLVYAAGILVTIFLSNDATAVVLTPAVCAAVKKARTDALAYLFICAFIANAASFVLPISNPANLIVYGKALPPLGPWLRTFLIPSLGSIAVTYGVLRWAMREEIRGFIAGVPDAPQLSPEGRRAAWGILACGAALIAASALGYPLGLPTCVTASAAVWIATGFRPQAVRRIAAGVAWSVLPFVAGLFVIVEALNRTGSLAQIAHLFEMCSTLPPVARELAASFGIAALSNVMNNLPSGLLAGSVVQMGQVSPGIRDAILIGVDLGPNLSVTGSLATILWLIALRREGIEVRAWRFLKLGAIVMPPALLLAAVSAALLSK